MKTSGGQKHCVTGFHANFLNMAGRCAITQCILKFFARQRSPESKKKFRAGIGCGDVPEFLFLFAAEFRSDFFRWMNLQRKFFLCVEQFDEQRKSRCVWNFTKNQSSILGPKFLQLFSTQRTVADDALRFWAIDDFPRFANANFCRQFFPELRLKATPAPHSFHENGLEGEGSYELLGHLSNECSGKDGKVIALHRVSG